jgi:hypothetical protein
MRPRKTLILTMAGIFITCWYVVRFEGDPKPVDPLLVALLHQGPEWYSPPAVFQNVNEPAAIYIVPALQEGPDGLFEALRLDVNSGARSAARIRFGPHTAYIPFDPAGVAKAPTLELHGFSLPRPTFHLFSFPGGGGPGFHLVDSSTGVVHVVTRTGTTPRTLLTLTVINSSRLLEMRSRLCSDRSRRLAAFLWRRPEGWTLYLFSLAPA